jgi:hypothetical protein
MERRKILVIGMFDSIHLARWLTQFKDQNIDFVLFPSKKFKYVNFELSQLFRSESKASFSIAKPYFFFKYIGFVDFVFCYFFKRLRVDVKKLLLRYCLSTNVFKYVHAIEIQGAGYLYASLHKSILDQNTLILTNYGSDIIYYKDFPNHKVKIGSLLSIAKLYSAECQRDYELALTLGFEGKFLPCIPNAGGFTKDIFDLNVAHSNSRNLIVAKCYGGIFGLGKLVIQALNYFLIDKPQIQVIVHSVTDDLIKVADDLMKKYPQQVRVFTVKTKIPRNTLLGYVSNAKIYVGASRSDGISTSFLEAICLGAYPIQTNSSCANEWLNLGFVGSLVDSDAQSILNALNTAFFDERLELYRRKNLKIAQVSLAYETIKFQANKFYQTESL